MATYTAAELAIRDKLFARYDQMLAHVQGFEEGITAVGDKLLDALINIGEDQSWQAQSLTRQIVHIQSQLRGQLNQAGYAELAENFISGYDESEIFGRQILQRLGKLDAQLIPMRSDTVANLKAFDLTAFNEYGNGIVRVMTKELVFNTVAGKKRSDVIKSLKDAMNGQEEAATLMADTSLRSFDRFVNNQLFIGAGITHFKYFGPNDNVTRAFCKAHVGKVYSIEQIKAMNNGSARYGNVLTFGGGPRCRHTWQPVVDSDTTTDD